MNSNISSNFVNLVLVGGGHAHLHVMKELQNRRVAGLNITLISEFPYQYYSGMAASFIEGIYEEDEIRFNLQKLCQSNKVNFIEGRAVRIDCDLKKIILSDGITVPFTILSMDTGSKIAGSALVGSNKRALLIKPLTNLQKLYKSCLENTNTASRLVIVGAGAAGIEMALAVQSHKQKLGKNVAITIVECGDRILSGYQPSLQDKVMKLLLSNNIRVMLSTKVTELQEKFIMMLSGEKLEYDELIWAGGVTADKLYQESGLQVDEKGFMLVNSSLQSINYPFIFGAGDCISFKDYDYVTKVGVYAIREAPILAENIVRYSQGKPLQIYTPQRTYLAILSLAHKTGILQYGKFVLHGKFCWQLKNYIDRSFMEKYKDEH